MALWPYEEAQKILSSLCPDTKEAIFQTGFGPSGLPHIGTFGEVSRTTFVRKAFMKLSSLPTRLISFCDDMDGLRKVPQNIPNQELICQHLGKPLVHIPDPYGCCPSFAHHMEEKLKEFLNSFGFDYEFHSSYVEYSSGNFNNGLRLSFENVEKIREIIIPTMQKENRAQWSPFMPICEKCGKNLTTRVIRYLADKYEIEYSCDQDLSPQLKGCSHHSVISIFNGKTKLGWKADWALRWFTFGVNYEMYGKDLIESFAISKKIVKILGGRPPVDFFYELFLDEEGAKISKSVGKGLTVDTWINYAPLESLEYYMYLNPRKAKRFHFEVIPKTVDEFLSYLRAYYHQDEAKRKENPISLIFNEETLQSPKLFDSEITYSLINNLVSALGTEDVDLILNYIYNYDAKAKDNEDFIRGLIEKVLNYYRDNILPYKKYRVLTDEDKSLLKKLVTKISMEESNDAEIFQSHVFAVAKENNLEPKDFFRLIYETLFGQTSGPKVGSFIKLIGKDEFLSRLQEKIG